MIIRLAFASITARSWTVAMTVLAMTLSVTLILAVEEVRTGAKASFAETISGTDLIMGARSGSVQLLLYSIFHIGNATNNITWESYQEIASRKDVDWIVPISLGDSHRQFRVMGTTADFFEHYKYRQGKSLELADGVIMDDLFDSVIGADVASALGYKKGDPIIVAHGIASFTEHKDQPFQVSGILRKTGTPIDRTVIVSLEAIEAIHVDWRTGTQTTGRSTPTEEIRKMDLTPKAITAALVGSTTPLEIFNLQRAINDYPEEPLLAVLPGVAIQELWDIVSIAEVALISVSAMVVVTALVGMMATTFSSLNERRREMAIFRSAGASPIVIFNMVMIEAIMMAIISVFLGFTFQYIGLIIAQPIVDKSFGLWLPIDLPTWRDGLVVFAIIATTAIVSMVPALRAYRSSIVDGMMVKV